MEMSPEKLADERAREAIRHELTTCFFVEAGAGSGKTSILVERMVNMVKSGIGVDKICAITFTKAAASEFYSRFRDKLAEEAEKGDAVCAAALCDIDLCFMGTIDSFCQMVLGEHPASAGIPSSVKIISEDDAEVSYLRFFSEVQRGLYGDELKQKSARFRRFNRKPESLFVAMTKAMAERRNADFIYEKAAAGRIDTLFAEEKADVTALFSYLLEHREISYLGNKDSVGAWSTLFDRAYLLGEEWETSFESVLTLLKEVEKLRLLPNVKTEELGLVGTMLEPHVTDKKVKWYELGEGYTRLCSRLENYRFAFSEEFVAECLSLVTERMRREGKLTFFDYQLLLTEMLEKDARADGKLIRHIYERHSYFLIDEFQDTNPMQAEIFFYLAAEKLDPDWRKCIPHKGSLFIVGDPKQSIYRFRSADVNSYQRVKALFTGEVGRAVVLRCNFRSTLEMCAWFNETFEALLPSDTENQSRFETIPLDGKTNPSGSFGGIYSYESEPDKDKTDYEALSIINNLVHNPAFKICGKGETEPRLIEYRDIMLITPTKTRLGIYAKLFAENGIPFLLEGSAKFGECPAFAGLVKLYAAVADPTDRNAVYGALTSGAFPIGSAAVTRYINSERTIDLFAEREEADDSSVGVALDTVKALYFDSLTLSPAAVFTTVLRRLKLLERFGTDNLEFLCYALELVREKTATGEIDTVLSCSRYLTTLFDGESGEERCLSLKKDQNRIHIANLHKVKGLEAPIVILAAQGKKEHGNAVRVEQTEGRPKCYLFGVEDNGFTVLKNDSHPVAAQKEKASQAAETIRLLYVAATRGRNVLIIGSEVGGRSTPAWAPLTEHCPTKLSEVLTENTAPKEEKRCVPMDEFSAEEADLFAGTSRNPSYEIRLPSKEKLKSVTSEDALAEDESDYTLPRGKKNPALVGTVVHRLMEVLVSSRGQVPLSDAVEETVKDYGADDAYYREILLRVGKTVQNGGYPQASGTPQDILAVLFAADEVHCELPFCYREGRNVCNGVMDVVYRTGSEWHIVDYKTNTEGTALDEKYAEQLDAYKKAFRELTGEDADAVIYHIEI